ncbi:MAG: electron transport complex subunit RsxC [Planctomycetes bacterium]|nr:electron transport complex subunit RsxC [Planctomycetota bacterium]
MLKTFKGGIHPHDMKELSKDAEIETLPLPDHVHILMSQHIGAPCQPCVQKGDKVKTGQVVGEAKGFVSAPVHASITGTVTAVEDRTLPVTGVPCPAVRIERESDEDEWAEGMNKACDIASLGAEEIKERIQTAGIVGLGGATFPTHVKLSPPDNGKIDAVILNGAECEPYLTCDYRLMLRSPGEIIEGMKLIMKVLDCPNGYIGIEANKPDCYQALAEAAKAEENISAEMLAVRYPQGAEHQLIHALLGREVPSGGLPMAVGCVVQNVATAYAIYEAVNLNKPIVERIVTITGNGVERPCNVLTRIGTPLERLLTHAGLKDEARRVILGGPMMGLAVGTLDLSTIKGTSGVLVLTDPTTWEPGPCIRCGECVRHCPMRLVPSELSLLLDARDFEAALTANIMDCKECGCCSYVCPAKRPIVQQIKYGKAELGAMKKKQEERAKKKAEP